MPLQKSRPHSINPQLIDSLAADVFWGYCFRTSYAAALADVLDGKFGRIWSSREAAKRVRSHGSSIGHKEAQRLYDETNRYMMEKARLGQNIIGTLYAEDFASCRPPAFAHGDLVRRLRDAGDGPENAIRGQPAIAGDLLLRTPLPSAVLLKADPVANVIRVEDTRKALGFQKTMLLLIRSFSPLPPNPQGYSRAAHGVFQIPCSKDASAAWLKLIPNGTAILSAVSVF